VTDWPVALSAAVCEVDVELAYWSKLLDVLVFVSVVSLVGEVGVGGSIELCESFVRFFFKKPRVGIWIAGHTRWKWQLETGAAASSMESSRTTEVVGDLTGWYLCKATRTRTAGGECSERMAKSTTECSMEGTAMVDGSEERYSVVEVGTDAKG